MSTYSKVLFFSCGGTTFLKMNKEDLKFFMESYNIHLKSGKMPKSEDELIAPLQSIYTGKAKIGQLIGEEVGENEMELNGTYRVCGSIASKYHIILGITNRKEVLIVPYKAENKKEVKALMAKNQDLFEKRFDEEEVSSFISLLKRNLGLVGIVLGGLLILQLSKSQSNLISVKLDIKFSSIV